MVSPFWEGLAGADVRAVLAAASTRHFRRHAVIYEQGRPATRFYLLATGRARFFHISPDGQKTILRWIGPGECLGVTSLLLKPSHYRLGAETVRESSLLVWSRESMRMFLDQYPRLFQNALSTGAEYLDWYIAAHSALVSETAQRRVASVLSHLTKAIGREVSGGVELEVTNEELAHAASVTLFTVSRILAQWQADGAVTKHRGRIVLHSAKRLFRAGSLRERNDPPYVYGHP